MDENIQVLQKSTLSAEVIVLLLVGIIMLILGGLLIPVNLGLLLLILAIQMMLLGETPVGSFSRTHLIVGGILGLIKLTGMLKTVLATKDPGTSLYVRILAL